MKYLLHLLLLPVLSGAFHVNPARQSQPSVPISTSSSVASSNPTTTTSTTTALYYEPKWKKKATLAETLGPTTNFKDVGLQGTIPVVFHQLHGNVTETKRTMALANIPLREAAIQAGQFIQYGCGKGECGTCECLVNGQWIRPCIAFVPQTAPGEEYVVQVKAVKNVAKSSGKFYSVRSFLFGFYNNVLGMVGMVKFRKNAKKNWEERREYEQLIRQKALEKKRARSTSTANLKP